MTDSIGFKAIASSDARVLILGTLPSAESLKRREYYAKKENAFWKIMGELAGACPDKPYAERQSCLKQKRIALWDVCASAKRVGSLDAKIQSATIVANDFCSFFKAHKQIELICFNGQPAEKLFCRFVLPSLPLSVVGLRRETLPSTSPAHAQMRFEEKLKRWREVLQEFIA
ncbi:MAG: DNA-deoxyinosine glycosylase [Alphaproteobacteria bacterium]|nr:DNA-deoxyinosine glycosylase [Alphaproteobacteria bacterium]